MATISKYQTASGTTLYRVRYRTPDHRSTQKRGFTTKRDAELFAATVEVSMARGEYVAPALGRATVGELATDWLARKKQAAAPSSWRMFESAYRVHVMPRWGAVSVADVDVLGVESWIAGMVRAGSGVTTVSRAHVVLSGILSDAVKSKRLAVNPARGVENLPRQTAKRHVYLSADDVYRLADESGKHRALVLVLAYCGLRWSEAIALRVADVEFLRRRLSVSTAAVELGAGHAVGPTKGRKARSVPVPEFVLNELSAQCKDKAPADLVFPRPGWRLSAAAEVSDRVVHRRGEAGRSRGHHSALPSAHVRVAGRIGRSERAGAAADARARQRQDDAGHLRGPVRRRFRRCGGHAACPLFT